MAPVAYMFQRKGKIQLTPRESSSFEEIWEVAVDANAQDVELVEQSDNESYVEVSRRLLPYPFVWALLTRGSICGRSQLTPVISLPYQQHYLLHRIRIL